MSSKNSDNLFYSLIIVCATLLFSGLVISIYVGWLGAVLLSMSVPVFIWIMILNYKRTTAAPSSRSSSPEPTPAARSAPSTSCVKTFVPEYSPEELTCHVVLCAHNLLEDLQSYLVPDDADVCFIVLSYMYAVFNSLSIRISPAVRGKYQEAIVNGLLEYSCLSPDEFLSLITRSSSMSRQYRDIVFRSLNPRFAFDKGSTLPRQINHPMWQLFFPELPQDDMNPGLYPLTAMAYLLNPSICKAPYSFQYASIHVDTSLSHDLTPNGADSAMYNAFSGPFFYVARNNLFPTE